MKKYWMILIAVLCFGSVVGIRKIEETARLNLVNKEALLDKTIRSMPLKKEDLKGLQSGNDLAEMLLDQSYGNANWEKAKNWEEFAIYFRNLYADMKRFPLDRGDTDDASSFSFDNSWASARTYGGNRVHEGTDIMPPEQKRDYYKVYSVSDGVVTRMGWLPQGGWRVGISGTHGTYFYYAHLSSYADIQEGDTVKAGTLLGYMGDTGYSNTPGTTGNFPVHLHFGIYFIVDGEEVSVNPYWMLRLFSQ
jgi:murein DD-endopeptidase MepM/ murein hydrolase activator NlpD